MPDQLNKQTLINLLIDSPLREPIKINLIDIVNNTSEPDLPKIFPTIVKELEIFQKATERRMKLADETISKLGGSNPAASSPTPTDSAPTTPATPQSVPPLDLPPLPTPPAASTPTDSNPDTSTQMDSAPTTPSLSVPPLDLPPLPTPPTTSTPTDSVPTTSTQMDSVPATPTQMDGIQNAPATPSTSLPSPEPLGGSTQVASSDEAALAEIQKELESLKSGVAEDAAATTTKPEPTTPQT